MRSLTQGTEIEFETKFDNKTDKKTLESILKIKYDDFKLLAMIKDSIQENVTMKKIDTKNKKDITNYTEEELMTLLQTMGEKAMENGFDEEKTMAAAIAVITSFPEIRTLGAPVILPTYISIRNSLDSTRQQIERLNEVRELQTGIYD